MPLYKPKRTSLLFHFTNLALIKDTTEMKKSAFFFNTIQGSVDDAIEIKVTVAYEDLHVEGCKFYEQNIIARRKARVWQDHIDKKNKQRLGRRCISEMYLFLIPLRQFYATPITGLSNVLEYFYMSDLESEMRGNAGEGVCFIFDGLDEYSQKYTKDGCSRFEQLLRGHIFPSSKIK